MRKRRTVTLLATAACRVACQTKGDFDSKSLRPVIRLYQDTERKQFQRDYSELKMVSNRLRRSELRQFVSDSGDW